MRQKVNEAGRRGWRLVRRWLVVPWVLAAGAAAAQEVDDEAGASLRGRPQAHAVRAAGDLAVDGRLDEEAWLAAEPVTRFTQTDPVEGAPVSEPTEVLILYDDEALYIGARLHDSRPVSSRLGRRDSYLPDSDWFSVSIDSYRDFRTAFRFRVNPSGVRSDRLLSAGTRGEGSWDPVWEVATAVSDSGWVVEMRIPFSQLRFRPRANPTWGLQLEREIARRQETAVFSFTPKSDPGGIARYGLLTGLSGIRPGSRLEVTPYVTGRAEYLEVPASEEVDFANPFRDGSELAARTGLDVKYRVTSNFTLDGTINPDFGQVEADPAEVNLSATESRFGERRPFFVEGGDIFRFGGGGWGAVNLFYSRRIGRSPQLGRIDDAVYADVPDAADILGAAKLTGKTVGGWSIGILDAVTQRETARYIDSGGRVGTAVVEPAANHMVARARREMRDGQSMLGGIFTAVNRVLGDERVREELRSGAYGAGVDFRHEWAGRSWSLEGYGIASHVRGLPPVMLAAQRSPARYYQRPDARHLGLDSAATSLSGYATRLTLEKLAGEHWRGNLMAAVSSPGFEVNDLGFYYDSDRVIVDSELTYVENRPGPVFRSWRLTGSPGARWNHGGDFLGASSSIRGSAELLSYWTIEGRVRHGGGGLDDRLTRGGPLARSLSESSASFQIRSDRRRPAVGNFEVDYERDEAGGWSGSLGLGLELRPAPNWNVSLRPTFSGRRSIAQYVGAVSDTLAAATFGRRYLFAELAQTTLSAQTRLNVIFTPDLSLEVYAEPFLASGDFSDLKELAEPRSYDFLVYGRDTGTIEPGEGRRWRVDPDADGSAAPFTVRDRDFRRGSLNGNAVVRWEWRPGSTLYLVWQQARSVREPVGAFRLAPAIRELSSQPADNILMLKLSYWFSR